MKVLIDLGNPGPKYHLTRHNMGFLMLDRLLTQIEGGPKEYGVDKKNNLEIYKGDRFTYLKPLTYMDLSGEAVRGYLAFYRTPLSDILVLHDELDLKPGQMKLKFDGSAAGQKGVQDIINKMGNNQFARLRLGIGKPPHEQFQISDFVLSKLSDIELEHWEKSVQTVTKAITFWAEGETKKAQELVNSYPAIIN